MLKFTRWCIAHRGRVFVAWVAIAIITTRHRQAVGRNYATNFTLPGTESQRALDLLKREFPTQSGDVDTIVFHVSGGTVDSPAGARRRSTRAGAGRRAIPHVVGVISPYGAGRRGRDLARPPTAFATINYDKRANLLPNATGKPVLDQVKAVHGARARRSPPAARSSSRPRASASARRRRSA